MKKISESRGITLIALVVTIIVLLILAAVSISAVVGENGIVAKAKKAQENTEVAQKQEEDNLKNLENGMNQYLDENSEITIGNVYEDNMIGNIINYESNTVLPEGIDWIILGKDSDENILITTSNSIDVNFLLNGTVDSWLNYENALNEACSGFGGVIQGVEVNSRSITLEDINNVTRFIEPDFNTYEFGNTLDFANRKVNFYYPDDESDTKWSQGNSNYEYNMYWYYLDVSDNKIKYCYEGNDFSASECDENIKNMELIIGTSESPLTYLIANKCVEISSERVAFWVDSVSDGFVGGHDALFSQMCFSNSSSTFDSNYSFNIPVRPIVTIPSNIKIEEIDGNWNIIY